MLACITPHGAYGSPTRSHEEHQERRETRRDIVRSVIEDTCSKVAEVFVVLVFVSDHGVERVDHFISHHERHSTQSVEAERSDDAVGEILRKCL